MPKSCSKVIESTLLITVSAILISSIVITLLFMPNAHGQSPTGVVEADAVLVKCADGFRFSEGPAVDKEGNIWFSDYGTDTIFRLSGDGAPEAVVRDIGGPIGLYFDKNQSLFICAARDHRIKKMDSDKTVSSYPDRYNGKLLNSPNDLWIDSRGGAYFTDPRFSPLPEEIEQDGSHIYYIPPDGSPIIRAVDDLEGPNGIIGSPDGKLVYVTDTPVDKTFVYNVTGDGRLTGKRLFADEGYDGLTVDSWGNVYITMQKSIEVYNPDGEKIDSIPVPDKPTNVCFGGADGKTLFITARRSLYSLRMRIPGL